MSNKPTQNPWQMDVRVRERNLKQGSLTEKDLEKNLAALPDLDGQFDTFTTPQPALEQPRIEKPIPAPVAHAAVSSSGADESDSDLDDEDDEDEDEDEDDKDDEDEDDKDDASESTGDEPAPPAAGGGEGGSES